MRSHMPSSSSAAASTSLLPSSDTTETASATTTTTMRGARQQHYAVSLSANLSYIQTLAVLLLGVLLLACTVCAERDFNFNDSQVPLLEPKDEPAYKQDPYITELTHCQQADSELLLSLVLSKHDWSVLSETKRAKVLNKFAKFFAIPKEFIVMDTVSKHELNEMQKAAMQRGAHKQNDGAQQRLGRISFVLGCGDKLFSMSEPIVKQIGHQVKDGSIDNITGEKFGWWLIWRKQMKSRARRQAEGSGDEDEDYEYEDSYDEAEPVTEQPTVPTHAHRHHHGVPELTDTVAAAAENNVDDVEVKVIAPDTNLLLVNNNKNNQNKLDEEIVESVSQLESVISKTIENTKNIKELPVIDDDVDAEADDELEKAPEIRVPIVEIEKGFEEETPNILDEEFNNELVDKFNVRKHETTTISTSFAGLPNQHTDNVRTATATHNNGGAAAEVIIDKEDANGALKVVATVPLERTNSITNSERNIFTEIDRINGGDVNIADVGVGVDVAGNENAVNVAEVIESESTSSTSTPTVNVDLVDANAPQQSTRKTFITPNTNIVTTSTSSISNAAIADFASADVTQTPSTTPLLITNNINDQINTQTQETPSQPQLSSSSSSSSIAPPVPVPSSSSSSSSQNNVQEQHQPFSPYDASSSVPASVSVPSSAFATVLSATPTATTSASATAASSVPIMTPTSIIDNNSSYYSVSGTSNTTSATTMSPQSQPPKEEDGVNGTLDTNDLSDVNRATLLNTSTSADTTTTSTTSTTQAQTSTTTTTLVPAIETTSSGYPSTDYVEPRVENTTPMIKTRLQKLAVTSGKAFRFAVPDETFYDAEDLTNLRLELTDKDGHELKANSWLQFNAETRELYGLPLDDTVSRWQYRLTATDSGNESVTETVEISVQQHRGVRTVNHEINIAVKINEKSVHKIDWQLKLINAIAETLGDVTNNAIVVREIRQTLQDPNSATLVYFNETLPTSVCPENELNTIVRRFDAIHLSNLVQPTLGIKSITGQLIGSCLKLDQTKTKPTTHVSKNLNPVPRNQIDRVNATVGCLLVYKVPADTFYDPNGDELTLTLRTKDNRELSALNWLQFDSKNREFYGVPKGGDIGSEEYLLVAEDEGGLTGIDALVVVVNPLLPKKEFSAFFKAFLAIRYGNFNANLQRKFVEGIAKLHGDPDTNQIQVRSITTSHDSDNTIVNFYNTSLHKTAHNGCPTNEIAATRNVYLINNNTLRDRVKKELAELNITNLSVMPYGSCYQHTDNRQHEFVPTKTEEPSLKSAFPEEYLITYILPAVIIIVMILIASLIACCLHRRRHKSGKMELGDEEERKSFRAKAPVIFQDELDEKPEIGNKSPIILKDEKPPLLPPSYNTLNANGENDVDEYVPPPAVVIGGREVRGKSPATPSYRKPPPYVSP